ncbi:hypothetical protein HmCmsJML281_01136 [Escherichia coli]|nr:hypothetical protein HmCmsJML281_01136 [Escherichia coli]
MLEHITQTEAAIRCMKHGRFQLFMGVIGDYQVKAVDSRAGDDVVGMTEVSRAHQ